MATKLPKESKNNASGSAKIHAEPYFHNQIYFSGMLPSDTLCID